jgi:replicative DNA helicase
MTRQKMLRPAPEYPAELLTEDGELGMLAMLLTDNRRVDQVADILRAEDFSVPYLGRIYGRVCELVAAGQQANPITLKPLLEQDVAWESSGGTAMLAQLTGGSAAAFMLVKALAKELEVAVIALAQLSRAVEQREDKRPQLSDLRDSGQIEQDADAVLFLYREEYYLERAKPKAGNEDLHERAKSDAAGLMTLILAKRRNGRVGNATCQYLAAYQAVRSFDWGR